jgi:hypothetical protein
LLQHPRLRPSSGRRGGLGQRPLAGHASPNMGRSDLGGGEPLACAQSSLRFVGKPPRSRAAVGVTFVQRGRPNLGDGEPFGCTQCRPAVRGKTSEVMSCGWPRCHGIRAIASNFKM